MSLLVITLAAGKGSRMRSSLPKPAHRVAGVPMLQWVVDAASDLDPQVISVVHGHKGEDLIALLQDRGLAWVKQHEQLGTGHAVKIALQELNNIDVQRVLVLLGDMPLIRSESIQELLNDLGSDDVGLLSTIAKDPTGMGRVVRTNAGLVSQIVEHKDATDEQKKIAEINTGVISFPAKKLYDWISRLGNNNKAGEYYLTDIISMAVAEGVKVIAKQIPSTEAYGINSRADLALAEREMQKRLTDSLLEHGVSIYDPSRCDIRGSLSCGVGVSIDINCVFEGEVTLANGVSIEPNCIIRNSHIGANTEIKANSVIENSTIGVSCSVGPFARIRPKTILSDGAKVGNFVETKNTQIGQQSKVNHLSYIGDAIVGDKTNIGAGTITCNYDGINKHQTKIGSGSFIGSGCQLVAPVEVGDGAVVGAGTTLLNSAPKNKLTINVKQMLCKDSVAVTRLQEKKEKVT